MQEDRVVECQSLRMGMDCVVVERSRPIHEPQFQGFDRGSASWPVAPVAKVEPVACARSMPVLVLAA